MYLFIVIIGIVIISFLGCGVNIVWECLIGGCLGVSFIDWFDIKDFFVKIVGQVFIIEQDFIVGFDFGQVGYVKECKKLDLFILYVLLVVQ